MSVSSRNDLNICTEASVLCVVEYRYYVDSHDIDGPVSGGVELLASSSPTKAAGNRKDAGEARSHPPTSQLNPGSHASLRLCSGLEMPLRMTFIRLKSIGLRIQPSIPSDSIYSRWVGSREAETAKIGMRPLMAMGSRE
jgi:hypothetical protein